MRSLVFAFAVVLAAAPAGAEETNLAKPPPDVFGNEPAATVTPQPVIMINKAIEAELLAHQQFGSLYAKKVIAGRPYDGLEDFRKRSGMPEANFERVKNLLDF